MSVELRRALAASLLEKMARGETWDGAAFRQEAAARIAEPAGSRQDGPARLSAYFTDRADEILTQIAAAHSHRNRLVIPADVVSSVLNSGAPSTDRGLRLANLTIDGTIRSLPGSAPTKNSSGDRNAANREKLKKGGKCVEEEHGIEIHEPIKFEDTQPAIVAAIPGIYFCKCKFEDGGFVGSNIVVKGNVVFEDCMLDYIYLGKSDIRGNIVVKNSRLMEMPKDSDLSNCTEPRERAHEDADPSIEPRASLSAPDSRIGGSIRLIDTLCVYGAIFDRARIDGTAYFYGSHLQCFKHPYDFAALSMDQTQIAGSLWLSGRHKYPDEPDYDAIGPDATHINDLSIDPTELSNVGGNGQRRNRLFCAIGGINLRGAKIGASFRCYGAIAVAYSYLQPCQDSFRYEIPLSINDDSKLQQEIVESFGFLGDAHELDCAIRAAGVEIGHDVDLHNKFAALGILDFTSSRIGRQLNFRLHPWYARIQLWPSRHLEGVSIWSHAAAGRLALANHQLKSSEAWLAFNEKKSRLPLPRGRVYLDLEDSTISDTLRIYSDKYHFNYVTTEKEAKSGTGKRLDLFVDDAPKPLTPHDAKICETVNDCVLDLRSVETETYTDDFDASDRAWPRKFYSVISVHRNWPQTMLLHLEGFNYARFRVDNEKEGGEDLLAYRTRNQWLRMQYGGTLWRRKELTGHRTAVEWFNRLPLFGFFIWRSSLLILSSILLPFKIFFNIITAALNYLRHNLNWRWRLNHNLRIRAKKPQLTRDYIKIDWHPRRWRDFQPGPWLHCAKVLRQSGRHADSRLLMLLRERYGLLDKRTVQLEKFWRHAVLMLAGHSYRRRRLAGWGGFALFLMFINYQIAFEAGLMVPAEAEVHVSDYHMDRYLNPPSLVRPNAAFYALEKLTPGLNFQLEEYWLACSGAQISRARGYMRSCAGSVTETGVETCTARVIENEKLPLACLLRNTGYTAPDWLRWQPLKWQPKDLGQPIGSFLKAPNSTSVGPTDCLAKFSLGPRALFDGCYKNDVAAASPTARWIVRSLAALPFLPESSIRQWLDAYYLNGLARIGGWLLMLFGWLLVGIGAASFAGMLHRED